MRNPSESLFLPITTLWANSAGDKLVIFFFSFYQKTGLDISWKLCLKCQILFSLFSRKQEPTFHANYLQWRQFAWNPVFWEKYFIMSSAENFDQGAKRGILPEMCSLRGLPLTLKAPITSKADDNFDFLFYFQMKTSLDISSESSAKQTIYMKYQDLFSLKNKKYKF